MGSRNEDVKQYKKSKSKTNKYIKALKKQNKMLYIISKKSISRREIKKIKKIGSKASKNHCDVRSNSSSDELDSNSSLSRYSD